MLVAAGWLGAGCDAPPLPEWTEAEDHRWRALRVRGAAPGFEAIEASRSGVVFVNTLPESLLVRNEILANGSGVAIGDVDGDGLADLYLCRLDGDNALYRNLGDWRFEDVTEAAGVALPDRFSRAAAFADADGDGDLDLLVSVHGERNALFLNDGSGSFRDATESAGFEKPMASSTVTLADVDDDGDLDLYVANYKRRWVRDIYPPEERAFDRVVERVNDEYRIRPPFEEHYRVFEEHGIWKRFEFAEPDEFYLNDGAGRFALVPWTEGRFLDEDGEPLARAPDDWGLSARFHDMDGDGDSDLYVTNDLNSPDHIWINDGSGTFRAIAPTAVRSTSAASMSVDFSDIDLDGHVDLFVSEMLSLDPRRRKMQVPEMTPVPTRAGDIETRPQVNRNTLQRSRGDGTFAEIARYANLEGSEWTWGVMFLDVDLDGREDLLAATGHVLDFLDADARMQLRTAPTGGDWRRQRLGFPILRVRNVAFRNLGQRRFAETGAAWGFSDAPDISHGMAGGDLDGDGDTDVVLNRLNAPALLLRNRSAAPRIAVRLRGEPPNTGGVGARIVVRGGAVPRQAKEVTAGGLYLSHAELTLAFAAGSADTMTIEVHWPSGRRSEIRGARPDRLYEVREAADSDLPSPPTPEGAPPGPSPGPPYFEDRTASLGHRHSEQLIDEFVRQPLLPLRLAQLGPGVSWLDADADDDPDLFVTSGSGGHLVLLENRDGRFHARRLGARPTEVDQTTVLGLPVRGGLRLLLGQMNYEAASPEEARRLPSVLAVELRGGEPARFAPAVPGGGAATGPLALADVDRDGDLDLFVGGRVFPAAYPVPADSRLLRNEGGALRPDTANAAALRGVGLVSGAAFSDVDGDGDPDLLLATEWGPVRLLINQGGTFTDATAAWGLAGLEGRWNGVATGDFDEDGRPDAVVTGWGENHTPRPGAERPLRLYYGDFDRNGLLDLVEARYEERVGGVVPLRPFEFLTDGMPYIRRNTPDHASFADATVEVLLGRPLGEIDAVQAVTLSHQLLLNRGGRFEARPLPFEAQLAPAFHAGVADFDGDGHDDLFLTHNFFATDLSTPRHDAGRSLWLRGDGTGRLTPVPAPVSGIEVYGDPRGAALADYDADGRVDLAVSQNGAATRLYRNRGATPGLRVRLVGPPQNPLAIGAALRAEYADGAGPLREVQAGSGYWSSDDAVQVLGLRATPSRVWVRWPDGRESTHAVAAEARELRLAPPTREEETSQ